MRPTLVGTTWAAVTGHPLATAVAASIFEAGGNAVDAGVAAGLASNVVQVDMCNLGGIAPMLIRQPGSAKVHAVAGVGRWSQSASLDEMLARHGDGMPLGVAPSIVPGALAAWIEALRRYGTMTLEEVAEPAIDLAERGFLLDERTATSLHVLGSRFTRWPTSAALYWPRGRPPMQGDQLVQAELGSLLRSLVAAERITIGDRERCLRAAHEAFYGGDVAARITEWVQGQGGFMELSDLLAFESEVSTAPSVGVRSWTVHSTPTWTQGPVALTILGLVDRLDRLGRGGEGPATASYWHGLVQAIDVAFADREAEYGDPEVMQAAVDDLLAEEHLGVLTNLVAEAALRRGDRTATHSEPDILSTTAIVTMDSRGQTFACTPSDTLDTAPVIPDLGIICSSRGLQSRLVRGHANALAPGRRPCVTPSSLIALKEGGLKGRPWALAGAGGDVIVQALAQVFWSVDRFGMNPQQAVEAPRVASYNFPGGFHPHASKPNHIKIEGRVGSSVVDELRRLGHDVEVWPDYEFTAGSVQMVMDAGQAGEVATLLSAADPRRSAYAQSR